MSLLSDLNRVACRYSGFHRKSRFSYHSDYCLYVFWLFYSGTDAIQ